MRNEDPDINRDFWDRFEKAIRIELFIKQMQIVKASTLTTDEIDNYPVLVFTIQHPPGYPKNMPEEFFVLPLSPRTVSRDNQPILSDLVCNSIIVAAGNLFDTVYGEDDSEEESGNDLTDPNG